MSKKDQAIELYQELIKTNTSPSRQQLIDLFVSKLGMTPAGASTYASMVKTATPGSSQPTEKVVKVKPTSSPKSTTTVIAAPTVEDSSKVDKRQLYSKCFFQGDEVVFSSSHYNAEDAKNFTPSTSYTKKKTENLQSFTIIGVPTDTDTVSFLKNKYKVII